MGRHPLDAVSLVGGLVFALLGALWFAGDSDGYVARVLWIGPALLIGAGLVLILGHKDRG